MSTLLGAIISVLLATALYLLVRALRKRPPARCSTCKHFDLHEGQAAMQAHPVFMQAAGVLSPSKMGTKITYDADGTRHEESAGGMPAVSKWSQFGACLNPVMFEDGAPVIRWGGDNCPNFARGPLDQVPELQRLVQIRR